jgi:hypothetical protein
LNFIQGNLEDRNRRNLYSFYRKSLLLFFIFFFFLNVKQMFGQTPKTIEVTPQADWCYIKTSGGVYSKSVGTKVGYELISGNNFKTYRKALYFNVGGIDDNATVTGCSIQFASGVPTDPAGNGTLEFRKLRWDFATLSDKTVYGLILSGEMLNSKAITTEEIYNVALNSYVQEIQNVYQLDYSYIGIGINNQYEGFKGTSFSNSILTVNYTIPTPPAPTNLRATKTATSINFAWDPSAGDVTGYDIYKDNVYYNRTTSTSMQLSGLIPGTAYKLYIIPFNGYGSGEKSVELIVTTSSYSISNSTSDLVCTSPNTTFTFLNRTSGDNITWTNSSNLVYVSGQGTDNYVVKGASSSAAGWVKGTLASGPYVTDMVWIGTPVVSVTGPDEGYPNVQYTFQAHTADAATTDPFSYTWDMYPYDGYISTSQGGNNAAYAYITFYHVYSASGYWVKARAHNSCGTGAYGQKNIWIHDYWLLSPNPASDIVTITRVVSNEDNSKVISSDSKNATFDIQIIDYFGSLHYQTTKTGDSFSIPVNTLKNGNYIIKVTNDKQTSNLILVVNH